jgi:hypothetical protein
MSTPHFHAGPLSQEDALIWNPATFENENKTISMTHDFNNPAGYLTIIFGMELSNKLLSFKNYIF